MAKNQKNTAPVDTNTPAAHSRFVEETELSQFLPWWKAYFDEERNEGPAIEVYVDGLDLRDPEFPRFIFRNASDSPLECFRGPVDSPESTPVQPNEQFTCSVYTGLLGLEDYVGLEVSIRVVGTREANDKKKNDMFIFKIGKTQETIKAIADRRIARALPASPYELPQGMSLAAFVKQNKENAASARG